MVYFEGYDVRINDLYSAGAIKPKLDDNQAQDQEQKKKIRQFVLPEESNLNQA